jgi:hypothetical protein
MTIEEQIINELEFREKGLEEIDIKMNVRGMSFDIHDALIRMAFEGKVCQVPSGKWKLSCYCSQDLIDTQKLK